MGPGQGHRPGHQSRSRTGRRSLARRRAATRAVAGQRDVRRRPRRACRRRPADPTPGRAGPPGLSLERAAAQALDAADPLAGFRDRFVITDPHLIYLDGNSLGRLPHAAVEQVTKAVAAEWGDELVEAWEHWIDLPTQVGDQLAAHVLGA